MSTQLATIEERREIAAVSHDPELEVEWAARCAKALVKAITGNPQLKVSISGKDYIKAEGWQTLGAMTKVDHIEVVWCREYTPPNGKEHIGWEVRVEVRDRDGNVRGTGEAMCVRTETRWKAADEFAIRSMAQTRALGKAYRMALSYVVALAGYEPTPAEEMPTFVPTPEPEPERTLPAGERPTAADRKKLDKILGELEAIQPHAGKKGDGTPIPWADAADAAARRDFKHGIGTLSKTELAELVDAMERYRNELSAQAALEGATA